MDSHRLTTFLMAWLPLAGCQGRASVVAIQGGRGRRLTSGLLLALAIIATACAGATESSPSRPENADGYVAYLAGDYFSSCSYSTGDPVIIRTDKYDVVLGRWVSTDVPASCDAVQFLPF